jgi:hypothetical protein
LLLWKENAPMKISQALGCLFLLVLLAACQQGAIRTVSVGEQLTAYDFSEGGTFEEGAYRNAVLSMRDAQYNIRVLAGDNELWWGQWGDTYDNVAVEARVEQVSERPEVAYGLMCRVQGTVGQALEVDPTLVAIAAGEAGAAEEATAEGDATPEATEEATAEATTEADATPEATEEAPVRYASGDGYLFLIQGNGSFGIFRADSRSLTPLVNWTANNGRVSTDPLENTLRAVCVGNYLAFYANGEFLADAIDDTYANGQVGMAASAANRLGAEINFDDLTVSSASVGG